MSCNIKEYAVRIIKTLLEIAENTELLIGFNEEITKEQMNLGGICRIDFLEELIRIYSVSCLDEKSFYSPVEGRKEFKPQEITEAEPDLELRQEKLRRMAQKMQKVLSPAKINTYVRAQLGEKKELLAMRLIQAFSAD